MGKAVCLYLASLFDALSHDDWRVRSSYGLWLEKSTQDETEYYDLYSDDGTLVGCDGETCLILREDSDCITLISGDAEESFVLSKKEFELTDPK